MFRILGFLVGSVASIGALVMLVGMPNFHLTGDADDENRYDTVIQQLREKRQPFAELVDEIPIEENVESPLPEDTPVPTMENDSGLNQTGLESTTDVDVTSADNVLPASDVIEAIAEDTALNDDPAMDITADQDLSEPGWQPIWNPFRSEIAANGFIRRLENVTGLDYRVVKIKNGVYEVAFAYTDDIERSARLSQISAATGLDLSDSVP